MSGSTDIVARLSGMAADHGPDGWPAVQMRDITELCEEVTRLRAARAQAGGREPLFYVRLIDDGRYYEGPVHAKSVGGKMMRDEKPGEWAPLYAHPAPAQREPLSEARVREMLNEANIELRSKWACYERGLRDGERAHGITPSGTKGAART